MTIKQILAKYPLKSGYVAEGMGRSVRWLNHQMAGYNATPATTNANRETIQQYLRNLGAEIENVNLSITPQEGCTTVEDFFNTYPFTLSAMAPKVRRSREWITGAISGRLLRNMDNRLKVVKRIEAYIRKIGKELKTITIEPNE